MLTLFWRWGHALFFLAFSDFVLALISKHTLLLSLSINGLKLTSHLWNVYISNAFELHMDVH